MPVPLFSLCVPIPALFDENYGKDFFTTTEGVVDGKSLNYLLSVAPQPNATVIKCAYRNFETTRMTLLERDQCLKFFKIKVYRLLGYVCYRYSPIPHNYTMFSVLNTFADRRILYSTVIDQPLNQGYKLLPMLHLSDYPTEDRIWNQDLLPSKSHNDSYGLSQVAYEIHRLPPPYVTNCGDESGIYCTTKCFQLAINKYRIQPINNIPELDDFESTFPTPDSSYEGKHIDDIHRELTDRCEKKCARVTKCDEIIVKTIISPPDNCEFKLAFSIETISQPVTRSNKEPKFTLTSLIFYCASLGSIWIGFSSLGLFSQLQTLFSHDSTEDKLRAMEKKCEQSLAVKKRIESNFIQRSVVVQRSTVIAPDKQLKHRYKPTTKIFIIVTSLVVKLSIFIGFLYQTYSISSSFFEFDTGTQLTFDLNPIIDAPSIAVCIMWTSMLGNSRLPAITRHNYNEVFNSTDASFLMPLGLMLNQSWSSDKIIEKCRYRRLEANQTWIHQLHSREECLSRFESRKFYYNGKICYSFKMKNNPANYQDQHKHCISDPGIFYSIILTEQALEGSSFTVTVYPNDRLVPHESNEFASVVYRTSNNRLLIVSPTSRRILSLPYPYEDRCNERISKTTCLRRCFRKKSLATFDSLPFTDIVSDEEAKTWLGEKKLLLYSMLNSTGGINKWAEIERQCSHWCTFNKCNFTVFNTLLNSGFRSQYRIELAVDVHSIPDVVRQSFPLLTLWNYLYQFFSTAAFWFAFTVISINPFSALVRTDEQSNESLLNRLKQIKKTIAILRHLIVSLNRLFGMRLMYRPIKTKNQSRWCKFLRFFVQKDASKCFNIFRILCTIGCSIHLFYAFTKYLEFPVTMKVFADVEERGARSYDVSICLSTNETLRANSNLNVTQSALFNEYPDDLPHIPVREIFQNTPSPQDILVACAHRGLRFSPLKNLTDRIYFFQLESAERCHALYHSEKYLLQGFTCYKFCQKRFVTASRDDNMLLINFPSYIATLMINSSYITREFLVTVSERGNPPAYSGVWAPTITKKADSVWMAFSYIKIIRHVLPAPFGNDGFTDSALVGCMSECLNDFLRSLGVIDPGIILTPPDSDVRYLTSRDLDGLLMRSLHEKYENTCKNYCYRTNNHESLNVSTFITFLSEWKHEPSGSIQSANLTQIHLTTTEYPVITVKFHRSQLLTDFFIIIGNILGIWFGLSAVHCDPLRYVKKEKNISLDQLTTCQLELDIVSNTINQMYRFFFAWRN